MFCIVGVVAVVVRSVPLLLIARLFLSLSFPSHQFRSTYFEHTHILSAKLHFFLRSLWIGYGFFVCYRGTETDQTIFPHM